MNLYNKQNTVKDLHTWTPKNGYFILTYIQMVINIKMGNRYTRYTVVSYEMFYVSNTWENISWHRNCDGCVC